MLCSLVFLAAHKNFKALTELAICYRTGFGIEQNVQEAIQLYRLAVDQRYPPAQFYLGFCFFHGDGVERDCGEAARLYRAAALQGHSGSHFWIGNCYRNGNGVETNKLMAACFFRLADELGEKYMLTSIENLKLSAVWN